MNLISISYRLRRHRELPIDNRKKRKEGYVEASCRKDFFKELNTGRLHLDMFRLSVFVVGCVANAYLVSTGGAASSLGDCSLVEDHVLVKDQSALAF
jgi:hypothetical protein